jgi:uncharacterized protein (TIGR02594 family)
MTTPAWLAEAYKYNGVKEIPGIKSAPFIVKLWDDVPWLWKMYPDDSILAWCGAFVHYCLKQSGLSYPKAWYRAKSYIGFGFKLYSPVVGCIGVVKNSRGQYHVGFVVGRNYAGQILMFGGNQNDSVKVSAFRADAFVYFCWPHANNYYEIPIAGSLPILTAELIESVA